MIKSVVAALALVAGISMPAVVHADVVVDTGAPPGIYSLPCLWCSGVPQSLFGKFTSNVSRITEIQGYILFAAPTASSPAQNIIISLYADNGGLPDLNSVLASGSVAIAPDGSSIYNQEAIGFYGVSGLDAAVATGSDYWVGFSATAPFNYFIEMVDGAPSPLASYAAANNFSGGSPYIISGYSLGIRVFGDNLTAAVPEPATWGMMILGFGLVGGAMRRGRRLAPA